MDAPKHSTVPMTAPDNKEPQGQSVHSAKVERPWPRKIYGYPFRITAYLSNFSCNVFVTFYRYFPAETLYKDISTLTFLKKGKLQF